MILRVWQWSEYYCKINPVTAVNKYDIFLCTNSNYKKKTLTFSTIIEQKKVKVVKPILTIWDDTQALYNTVMLYGVSCHNGNRLSYAF